MHKEPTHRELTAKPTAATACAQVQRELEEERALAEQAAREAQAAIEAKQSELQAIEAARQRAARASSCAGCSVTVLPSTV